MADFKVALLLLSVLLYVEAVPYYVSCPYSDPFDRTLFFPHETNCHLYYKCDHGRVLKEDCPADLHWNPKLNTCDWPWHAGCVTSGTGSGGEGSGGTGSSGSGGEGNGSSGSGGEASGGSGSLPPDSCPVPDPGYVVYLPDPSDCTIFYECTFGEPVQLSCPDGLHFNPTAHVCDLPELAGCSSNGEIQSTPEEVQTTPEEIETTPQPPQTTVPTEEPTTPNHSGGSQPPVSCPDPDPGYIVYLPDPNDCTVFYECTFGVPVQFSCPAGTHFNPIAHVCDLPELAGCSNNGEIQSTPEEVQTTAEEIETTPQPPQTTVPTEEPTIPNHGGGSQPPVSCPNPDPGYIVYLPDPNDCTVFYECTFGVPVQFSCPAGTHFNPTAHVCDLPELAGCSNNGEIQSTPEVVQTTAQEIETTPQPPQTTVPTEEPTTPENGGGSQPPVSCPVPDPGYIVYLPDPNDCSVFYECTFGVPVQFSCPVGLHFNPTAHVCDTPEHAGCSHSGVIHTTPGGVKTTVVPTEEPTTPGREVTDSGNSGGEGNGSLPPNSCPDPQPGYTVYLPDPNDCSIFYECSFGVPYQLSCPVGLHFNPTAHVCDTPEHAGCIHSGVIHTTPRGVQTTAVEIETTAGEIETSPDPPSTIFPTDNPGDQTTTSGSVVTNNPSGICPTAPEPSCPYTTPDVSVFFPHPTDNHFFFHCSYGVPYCKICPAGLIWHQELQRCDF